VRLRAISSAKDLPGEFVSERRLSRDVPRGGREIESFEKNGGKLDKKMPQTEEPTRLFSGLMLARTNERFQ